MIREPGVRLEDMPHGRLNFLDLQSAIELFTPLYQLMLTDNDFWRATNSLQLDETIGIYAATLLDAPEHLILVNNKHPLVPLSTLRAGLPAGDPWPFDRDAAQPAGKVPCCPGGWRCRRSLVIPRHPPYMPLMNATPSPAPKIGRAMRPAEPDAAHGQG